MRRLGFREFDLAPAGANDRVAAVFIDQANVRGRPM